LEQAGISLRTSWGQPDEMTRDGIAEAGPFYAGGGQEPVSERSEALQATSNAEKVEGSNALGLKLAEWRRVDEPSPELTVCPVLTDFLSWRTLRVLC
jgi:hypothetical protein